jgi:hypothetical protein
MAVMMRIGAASTTRQVGRASWDRHAQFPQSSSRRLAYQPAEYFGYETVRSQSRRPSKSLSPSCARTWISPALTATCAFVRASRCLHARVCARVLCVRASASERVRE